MPVGAANVVESKERLFERLHRPRRARYIVAMGRKGGSNVAAAILLAPLVYSAAEDAASPPTGDGQYFLLSRVQSALRRTLRRFFSQLSPRGVC
ncbi:MAG: precorrin-8X methylmutase [Faecalibacterium prausnitzii]